MFALGGRSADPHSDDAAWFPDRPAESECDSNPTRILRLPDSVEGYALGINPGRTEEPWRQD